MNFYDYYDEDSNGDNHSVVSSSQIALPLSSYHNDNLDCDYFSEPLMSQHYHTPDEECHGFIFAFKVYHKPSPQNLMDEEQNHEHSITIGSNNHLFGSHHHCNFANHLENMVHCLTRSDIIHVELIPVLGCTLATKTLVVSQTAYSAYVGVGFDEHDSSFCITDPTFRLIYIPMSYETMLEGIRFLHAQRGKQYNYLALPLTILPTWCKKRKVTVLNHDKNDDITDDYFPETSSAFHDEDEACDTPLSPTAYHYYYTMQNTTSTKKDNRTMMDVLYNPSKVFCSQLGLSLCYLCDIFPEKINHTNIRLISPGAMMTDHEDACSSSIKTKISTMIMDPMCCTPAELFKLLASAMTDNIADAPMEWPQSDVVLHDSL